LTLLSWVLQTRLASSAPRRLRTIVEHYCSTADCSTAVLSRLATSFSLALLSWILQTRLASSAPRRLRTIVGTPSPPPFHFVRGHDLGLIDFSGRLASYRRCIEARVLVVVRSPIMKSFQSPNLSQVPSRSYSCETNSPINACTGRWPSGCI